MTFIRKETTLGDCRGDLSRHFLRVETRLESFGAVVRIHSIARVQEGVLLRNGAVSPEILELLIQGVLVDFLHLSHFRCECIDGGLFTSVGGDHNCVCAWYVACLHLQSVSGASSCKTPSKQLPFKWKGSLDLLRGLLVKRRLQVLLRADQPSQVAHPRHTCRQRAKIR